MNCDKIEADVDIFYNGRDASQEEKDEMFALLTETIQAQQTSGTFANEAGATVESVQVVSTESNSDRGLSAGATVGVVVAALAVVVVLLAVVCCCCCKKKQQNKSSPAIVDTDPDSPQKKDEHMTDDSSAEGGCHAPKIGNCCGCLP